MKQSPRIPGYDIARFLAVFGFVAVDMVGQVVWSDEGGGFGERPEGPTALYWLWQGWWGRVQVQVRVRGQGSWYGGPDLISDDCDVLAISLFLCILPQFCLERRTCF